MSIHDFGKRYEITAELTSGTRYRTSAAGPLEAVPWSGVKLRYRRIGSRRWSLTNYLDLDTMPSMAELERYADEIEAHYGR